MKHFRVAENVANSSPNGIWQYAVTERALNDGALSAYSIERFTTPITENSVNTMIHYFNNETSLSIPITGNLIRVAISVYSIAFAMIYLRLNDDDSAIYTSSGVSSPDNSSFINVNQSFWTTANYTTNNSNSNSITNLLITCDGNTCSLQASGGRPSSNRNTISSGYAPITAVNSLQIFNSQARVMTGYVIYETSTI